VTTLSRCCASLHLASPSSRCHAWRARESASSADLETALEMDCNAPVCPMNTMRAYRYRYRYIHAWIDSKGVESTSAKKRTYKSVRSQFTRASTCGEILSHTRTAHEGRHKLMHTHTHKNTAHTLPQKNSRHIRTHTQTRHTHTHARARAHYTYSRAHANAHT
jgi:hypothetical protein